MPGCQWSIGAGTPSLLLQRQLAVFRPSTREWFLRKDDGSAVVVPFGGPGDQPVPADYLGLGRAEIAVFRPDTGEWFLRADTGATVRVPSQCCQTVRPIASSSNVRVSPGRIPSHRRGRSGTTMRAPPVSRISSRASARVGRMSIACSRVSRAVFGANNGMDEGQFGNSRTA